MSRLPEREAGIFRMATDIGYATDWLTELVAGRTTTRREIGRFVITVEFSVTMRDASIPAGQPGRWYERHRVMIDFAGLRVFDAWQGREVFSDEPDAHLVVDFIPGPWETRLANLWRAERSAS